MSKYTDQHGFSFDHVFSEHVPNEVIFDKTVKCLIQEILSKRGCKATCFVYGQTGSGKTYTMLHPRNGLYVLAAQEILGAICSGSYKSTCALGNAENNGVSLYVGFYEIYQGQLYDLLQGKTRIFAREDHHQLVQIVGLKEYRVESIEEFQRFVDMGVNERRTGNFS